MQPRAYNIEAVKNREFAVWASNLLSRKLYGVDLYTQKFGFGIFAPKLSPQRRQRI
jgi:hypothetical protein